MMRFEIIQQNIKVYLEGGTSDRSLIMLPRTIVAVLFQLIIVEAIELIRLRLWDCG